MKISIVTAAFNSAATIGDTLSSVARQDFVDVEHIVADGASSDETCAIATRFPHVASLVSEPDLGVYDGMNRGIDRATGDVVGLLNSDDYYPHSGVLSMVAAAFEDPNIDAVIGDIAFVDERDRITRHYSAAKWAPEAFRNGFMPPHPSFFVRRSFYETLGTYEIDYRICADFELMVRFLFSHRLRFRYLPEIFVHMRPGGISTKNWKSKLELNRETKRAADAHGLGLTYPRLAWKYVHKVREFRPRALIKST